MNAITKVVLINIWFYQTIKATRKGPRITVHTFCASAKTFRPSHDILPI